MPELPPPATPGEVAFRAFALAAYRLAPQHLKYQAITPSERQGWEACAQALADYHASEIAQGTVEVAVLEAITQFLEAVTNGATPMQAYVRIGKEYGVLSAHTPEPDT